MGKELSEMIRRALEEERAIDDIRSDLVSQGFMEEEVMDAIAQVHGEEKSSEEKRDIRLFTFKEILDRVGYGFASIQLINILFWIVSGYNLFLVGLVNGLKTVFSLVISSLLQEYSKVRRVSNAFLSWAGILFGFSFFLMSIAVILRSKSEMVSLSLFAFAILVGSVGVVTYGDLYQKLVEERLKREKLGKFLLRISHWGVMITAGCLVLSGFLFDKFPMMNSTKVMLFGKYLPLHGYLISFEITAISFILSGYVLNLIKDKKVDAPKIKNFVSEYLVKIRAQLRQFVANKYLLVLLLASSVTGLIQILGNSFYGIFIYDSFKDQAFGGFLNVAIIFAFAILVSFLGPIFSEYVNRRVGLAPTLVFGTLLVAIMPLVCAYNPRFLSVSVANALSVVGSAILGMGQGLLVRKLLNEEQRRLYFAGLSIAVSVPFLLLVPLGGALAQSVGLETFFKVLAFVLIVLAAPIFFALVAMANKLRL